MYDFILFVICIVAIFGISQIPAYRVGRDQAHELFKKKGRRY